MQASIFSQSFDDYEIIMVDDGSTDSTPKLLDDLAEKHPDRIRVFHKENGGQSTARNLALSEAKGEYVVFWDSDDYAAPDMFEKLAPTDKDDLKLLEEVKREQGRIKLTEPVTCRPAVEDDLPALLQIAGEASAWLKKQKVDQWQDGYPAERHFRFDLERGELFAVCHGEELAGFFTLSGRRIFPMRCCTAALWRQNTAARDWRTS